MVEICLDNLSKNFADDIIIDSLNLKVKPGELVALLGPSGCGKTTTLKIISGLLDPDQGDLIFDGESVLNIATETRGAVLVFQDYLLFPHMTVGENIGFGLKMQGESKSKREKRVKELLKLINLNEYDKHYPNELSGGQRQRVALARSLAINPKVLLLDEPFSNLDANLRGEMQKFIRNLHKKEEMTTIFVTHDRDEAMLIADKIAVMNQGKIEQYGNPEELYRHPGTKFVADFFGKANYLKGQIKEGVFYFLDIDRKLPISDKLSSSNLKLDDDQILQAMIRPEFIEFITKEDEKKEDRIRLEGVIKDRKFVGEKIFYQVDIGGQLLDVTSLPQSSVAVGEKISIKINLDNIWFMEG